MKYLQRIGLGLLSCLLVLTLLAQFLTPKVSAAADTIEKDLQRRKMHHLEQCLTAGNRDDNVIDIQRDYSSPMDPIGDKMDDENRIVGFDMESGNGVMSCANAIRLGVNVLYGEGTIAAGSNGEKTKENVGAWLIKYLTNKTFGEDSSVRKRDTSAWQAKIDELKQMARAKNTEIGGASGPMLQRRFAPLLSICYNAYEPGASPVALTGNNGFEVEGVGVFIRKDASDVWNNFIKPNGAQNGSKIYKPNDGVVSSTSMEIGDIDLQQDWDGFEDEIWKDWGDFYPIGDDTGLKVGLYRGGIAECSVIENDAIRAFLFLNSKVSGGKLVNSGSNEVIGGDTTPTGGITGGGTAAEEDNSCESSSGPLGWIMCPIAGLMDSITGWLDGQVQGLLVIKDDFFMGDSGAGLKRVWTQIRNIAYIILIPIMLIMVVGTALGFEVFSAYTVKKALPRLVIAVIFITLSWYICMFLIGFFNVVGAGIRGLVTAPFTFEGEGLRSGLKGALDMAGITQGGDQGNVSGVAEGGVAVLGVTGFLAAIAGGAFSIGIILSTLASAAIVMGIVFIVLIARQMFIIAMLLIAPLAILAWIFPGNDKLWKLWWNSFSKLLMMFPLIMLIIGVGEVFSYVAAISREGDSQLITAIIVIAATIVPYVLIPFTFKFAGGLFANLAGMVNDRNKGVLDRLKKGRSESRKQLHERAGMNKRWNPSGALGRFNSMGGWVADPKNSAAIQFRTRGGRALASELTQKSGAQAQDLAKWMSGAGFNQEAATAVMKAVQEGGGVLTEANLQKQIGALEAAKGTQNMAAANVLRNSGAFLLNTYKSEEYGRANVGMAAGYVKASQGFMNSSDPNELANYANFLNEKTPGLGETFKTQAGLMGSQGGLGKVGYSEQVDQDGNYIAGGVAARAIQLSRSSVRDITGAKSSQLKQHFLGQGKALDQIVHSDGVSDPATHESITINDTKRRAVLDNVAQAAYGYDTPAETAEALRIELDRLIGPTQIVTEQVTDRNGAIRTITREVATTERGRMVQEIKQKYERRTVDPAEIDGRAPPPPADD